MDKHLFGDLKVMCLHFLDILAVRHGIIVDTLKPILMYGDSDEAKVFEEIVLRQRYDDMFPKPTEEGVLMPKLQKYVGYLLFHS